MGTDGGSCMIEAVLGYLAREWPAIFIWACIMTILVCDMLTMGEPRQ
jgi:hypothetical protein